MLFKYTIAIKNSQTLIPFFHIVCLIEIEFGTNIIDILKKNLFV